jgi:predicted TPR repeat methyltransferase
MLNALTHDNKNPKACSTYVNNLFNNYALYYDQHMQGALSYTLPQHLARLLHNVSLNKVKNAIDLGCGTGLCGNILREVSTHLTGVDIAAKMLLQARHKAIYDQLIEEELISFLQHDKSSYDLMLAADVLPYLGELDTFFLEISTHLTPGGYFLFSHEISPNQPWQLQDSARFSHHPDYIQQRCEEFKLKIIEQASVVGRQQKEQSLDVMIYVVQK